MTFPAPSDISLACEPFTTLVASGSKVATISTTGGTGPITYALEAGVLGYDNNKFLIVGTELRAAVNLNYTEDDTYFVRIRATDAENRTYTKYFTLDKFSIPGEMLLAGGSVSENNAINAMIGPFYAYSWPYVTGEKPYFNDPDIVYSVQVGADKFNISGNWLRASVKFDYETATSHEIVIRATSTRNGMCIDFPFTISVLDSAADNPISLPPSINLIGGRTGLVINKDPRVAPITQSDGSPLPVGSIVKNSATNEKFMKKSGSATEFSVIPPVPATDWSWQQDYDVVWVVLHGM